MWWGRGTHISWVHSTGYKIFLTMSYNRIYILLHRKLFVVGGRLVLIDGNLKRILDQLVKKFVDVDDNSTMLLIFLNLRRKGKIKQLLPEFL